MSNQVDNQTDSQADNQGGHIPADPIKQLHGRCVFIAGTGRSGTTVLAQLLGSMDPVYYVFEPVCLRLLLPLMDSHLAWPSLAPAIRSILFDGHIIPRVMARACDCNIANPTYTFLYDREDNFIYRAKTLTSRNAAMEYIHVMDPVYLIKLPNMQPLLSKLPQVFPDAGVLHIYRNGLDVIGSSMARGWYTDSWCSSMSVEWHHGLAPHFLAPEDLRAWAKWNLETRIACVWRTTTEHGLAYSNINSQCLSICYETMAADPAAFIDDMRAQLNLRTTTLVDSHIQEVLNHEHKKYDAKKILRAIDIVERDKFEELMYRLGYENVKI